MIFKDFFYDERFSFGCEKISQIALDVFLEEERLVAKAVSSRQLEFKAARSLARKTMQKWHKEKQPILIGQNRMPLFPDDIVGSISHTSDYAAAISASKKDFAAIGIDIEQNQRVTKDLWHLLFTEKELSFFDANNDKDWLPSLFFSAKEAFFKMQYPLTYQMLDFKDADIILLPKNQLKVLTKPEMLNKARGCFLLENGLLCSLFYLKL